jgi:putative N6-adenine-specific DNA methylase
MLFVVCAPGLPPVTAEEVRSLGLSGRTDAGGLELDGDLPEAMRLNLWLRTASRVLLRIGQPFRAVALPELVRKAGELPWERFIRGGTKVAFRVTCRKSRLYHSGAVAERLHAALQARTGHEVLLGRVADDEDTGELQLFLARLERDVCTVSADTSGALLHQRGWRGPQAKAPLRETLAATLLLAAGFRGDEPVCDPLCGSGTIAIEAALISMRRAPGIGRSFAFQNWPEYSAGKWEHLLSEARTRERPAQRVEASDQDAGAVAAAKENATRAGVAIEVVQRRLADLPPDSGTGLLASNPPYGKRVGADVRLTFRELAEAARRRPRWRLALVTAHPAAASTLRLASMLRTQNGGISVEVLASAR